MRGVKIKLAGREIHLLFNGAAMFELKTALGGKSVFEAIKSTDPNHFENLCKVAAVMGEQGELYRRFMGHDKQPITTFDELKIIISPAETIDVMDAILQAVTLGYTRETEDEEAEVDVGLAELNKKKVTAD